ncbi:nitronate monooxygenase [Sinomicrobium oceani]|uniref:Propionate 3-nitronate monooxygenase n=1 Tax=Sinomicrobium oceani TaxID=1150368 RepID=A0A1K1PRH5_9FLAO|nr:nitronate monooxygenase [Sinomicrobium oceani]SFW50045.1 nitronate monooxygenase [Sinomicrobium oceani]
MATTCSIWENDLTRMLGVTYPVVQAPMMGVTTPEMVAGAGMAGCLGSISLGDLPPEDCIGLIRKVHKLTDQPFAANIFVHEIPELDSRLEQEYKAAKAFIENLARQHELYVQLPEVGEIRPVDYHEQIDALVAEGIRILSFTFGNLDAQSIDRLKEKGVLLIGTCTTPDEAVTLEKSGIDIICVQGIEAGGHRGSFGTEMSGTEGFSLLPRVRDGVNTPLIYAGGICDGSTLNMARDLGAQGVQVGSLLLGSEESALEPFEKDRLLAADKTDVVLTRSFSGRYARGIRNLFTDTLEKSPYILPYPYQNKLTSALRKLAKSVNHTEFVSIWTGQADYGYSGGTVKDIMEALLSDAEGVRAGGRSEC